MTVDPALPELLAAWLPASALVLGPGRAAGRPGDHHGRHAGRGRSAAAAPDHHRPGRVPAARYQVLLGLRRRYPRAAAGTRSSGSCRTGGRPTTPCTTRSWPLPAARHRRAASRPARWSSRASPASHSAPGPASGSSPPSRATPAWSSATRRSSRCYAGCSPVPTPTWRWPAPWPGWARCTWPRPMAGSRPARRPAGAARRAVPVPGPGQRRLVPGRRQHRPPVGAARRLRPGVPDGPGADVRARPPRRELRRGGASARPGHRGAARRPGRRIRPRNPDQGRSWTAWPRS